jgi:RhtB (resistance to homoserine/threonine) family protein
MENYMAEFIAVAGLHLLAVMSPGPDFVMITRSSLIYSRKAGVYSAIGLALGILVHVTYSLVGLAYIISKSIILFSTLKFLGAGYLIYIGYKSLRAKPNHVTTATAETAHDLSNLQAIRLGFLTNALNPKATLFFLALFTQVIDQATPLLVKMLYGIEMSVATFVWFGFVALVLSHQTFKAPFVKVQHYVEKTTGLILIGLGLKVALSKR